MIGPTLLGAAAILLLSVSPFTAASSHAQSVGYKVRVTGPQDKDLYLAGADVRVDADVRGDVAVAGGRVHVDGRSAGDVAAFGGLVTVSGAVADDVRGGGGQVEIVAEIGGDVIAVAYGVDVHAGTAIGGEAILTGREVFVAGDIRGDLWIAARRVSISGAIGGDVEIAADGIELLEGARIGGDLNYLSSREAQIAPSATVLGKVERLAPARAPPEHRGVGWLGGAFSFGWLGGIFSFAWLAGLAAIGALLLAAFPESLDAASRNIGGSSWRSLGYGLLALFAVPWLALFCLITVIGMPLAVALTAGYVVALFFAYVTAAFWLGGLALRLTGRGETAHRGWRMLALVVALLALALARWVPVVGWLATFLALTFGLGAWVQQVFRSRAPGSAA